MYIQPISLSFRRLLNGSMQKTDRPVTKKSTHGRKLHDVLPYIAYVTEAWFKHSNARPI